jgi:hypothetical protein
MSTPALPPDSQAWTPDRETYDKHAIQATLVAWFQKRVEAFYGFSFHVPSPTKVGVDWVDWFALIS